MNNRIGAFPAGPRATLILATAVTLSMALRAAASDEGDFEYWAKASFFIPINQQWRFNFEERLTFGDDGGRFDDHQADYCFNYSGLADWLMLGFGYKQVFEKDGDDWQVENRPLVNITVKGPVHKLFVISRSRFEYRMPEDSDDVWRYRNKFLIASESPLKSTKILPYVAEEFFVSFDDEDFNQQRLQVGFFIPLHRQVRLELFYCWKLDEQDDNSWHDTNVVGSYIYFRF